MKTNEKPKSYDKRNDAHWCWGVFGPIAGLVLLALSFSSIWPMIRDYAIPLMGVLALTTGVINYTFWRQKRNVVKALGDFQETCQEMGRSIESTVNNIQRSGVQMEPLMTDDQPPFDGDSSTRVDTGLETSEK